ncbi:MAG: S-methyl-5'-thioadenosine phosphorylase [Firmicutes bacterium HGW-Firmicutes-14]|nr:MAG: S-methyl-5'-thioadenosine phosphorylase [Firmicutes bacterium HGW-Firmicutes-14]
MVRIGIIGGTGVYDPKILKDISEEHIRTDYGNIRVTVGKHNGIPVAFLPRHGEDHTIPPHRVNYRGNIMALRKLGVERILATGAVGSLNLKMNPGEFVLVDQFIDFTKNRPHTFFEDGEKGVVHIDMTEPYCREFRKIVATAAATLEIPLKTRGTYICTEGPRFETPAEIKMYSLLGGHLVGMTGVPEVVLAREAEMCYVTVAMITNFAAGISPKPLTHTEVLEAMGRSNDNLRKLIMRVIEMIPEGRNCECQNSIEELGSLGQGRFLS